MKSFDTNVIVRLLVKDDPAQGELAGQAWRRAITEGGAFLSATVLVEVVWVLRTACKLDRATIVGAVRRIVDSQGVTVEHETVVRAAIDLFEGGTADFSDYFILESSRKASALPVVTFDQRFARTADVQMLSSS